MDLLEILDKSVCGGSSVVQWSLAARWNMLYDM